METGTLISVVILNWNRLEDTKRAIDSVLLQTYLNLEIIVVDNASSEHDSESLINLYPSIRYHRLDRNYGCPGGRNRGINICNGDYIFFVDNDGILDKRAIENAYSLFIKDEKIGIVSGKIILFKSLCEVNANPPIESAGYFTAIFAGGVSMHKKSIYEEIGMFNEDFIYGNEETNLSLRLLTIKQFVYYSSDVILWHKASEAARNGVYNYVSKYSNKLVTYWELLPLKQYVLFSIWFLLIYPINCYRNHCLLSFVKLIPRSFIRANKARLASQIRLTNKEFTLFKYLADHKVYSYQSLNL